MICPYCLNETAKYESCHFCRHPLNTAEVLWWGKLCDYNYPADLTTYSQRSRYPNFFDICSDNRESTIKFENHFRKAILTPDPQVAPFLEVIFWKMYSQGGRAEILTNRLGKFLSSERNRASELKAAINEFVISPSGTNAQRLISSCGLITRTIAVAFTFPALYEPTLYPMVDKRVATWVNTKVATNDKPTSLMRFRMNYTSLQINDFDAYLRWIEWCRKQADLLSKLQPKINWRARDVEMACFADITYQLPLEVI
jgi:hypothetical protein